MTLNHFSVVAEYPLGHIAVRAESKRKSLAPHTVGIVRPSNAIERRAMRKIISDTDVIRRQLSRRIAPVFQGAARIRERAGSAGARKFVNLLVPVAESKEKLKEGSETSTALIAGPGFAGCRTNPAMLGTKSPAVALATSK